jgi:hypothetical protein
METKICTKCSVEKPLNEFSKHKWCKKCLSIHNKKYYSKNKSKVISKIKKYQSNNKEKILANKRIYDPKYNQKHKEVRQWRNLLYRTLRATNQTKTFCTYKELGYTPKELKEYLSKQEINWTNKTIDHKVPITWFKPSTPAYIVNSFDNLHLLSEYNNKSKRNRFCSPAPSSYIEEVKPWIKKQYLSMLKISRL